MESEVYFELPVKYITGFFNNLEKIREGDPVALDYLLPRINKLRPYLTAEDWVQLETMVFNATKRGMMKKEAAVKFKPVICNGVKLPDRNYLISLCPGFPHCFKRCRV
mgnify:FL=1